MVHSKNSDSDEQNVVANEYYYDPDYETLPDDWKEKNLVLVTPDDELKLKKDHTRAFSDLTHEMLDQANTYNLAKQHKLNTDLNIYHQKQYWKTIEGFYKTVEGLDEFECKSLVFAHNIYIGNTSANIEFDDGAFKSTLVNIFKTQQNPIQYFHYLMQFKINNQLPNSSLNWLKDSLRYSLHIAYLIKSGLYNKSLVGGDELIAYILNYLKYQVAHFNYIQLTYVIYDINVIANNHPLIGRIETVKTNYFNNRTKDGIKWLKGDDVDQIEWAYNYLSSEKKDYLILQNIFVPVSLDDKYSLILASLDALSNSAYSYEVLTKDIDMSDRTIDIESISEISYRAKVINNMKDAWVKISASNKNEELSEVETYKKNQDQLDSIIKVKGGSAKKVVSQIIEEEYKRRFNKD